MNENSIFEERIPDPNKKPIHAASLAIGILSLVFSLLIALVGDILGIVGIVLASQKTGNLQHQSRPGVQHHRPGPVCSQPHSELCSAVVLYAVIGKGSFLNLIRW